MFDTLNFTETLTIKCCPACSIRYAAPESMFVRIKERGGSWYCPNGHSLQFHESEADRLKKALDIEKRAAEYKDQRIKRLHDDLDASNNRLRATKAAKTRLKNRIAAGVCPCCNRTFQDLARHMVGKHPEFKHE